MKFKFCIPLLTSIIYFNIVGSKVLLKQGRLRPEIGRLASRQQCDLPNLKYGMTKIRQRGKLIRYQCNKGYTLIGNMYAGCVSGKWDTPIPICAIRGCEKIQRPENGFILEQNGIKSSLYCKEKYQIAGGHITYCNGTHWDRPLGICRETSTATPTWCDFETEDLCQWSHDSQSNDFDWKRVMGRDTLKRVRTGPQHDHTTLQSNSGHYMLIESSSNSLPDDSARLISPLYYGKKNIDFCLRFWYFMFGATVGTLRAFIKPSNLDMDTILKNPKYLLFEKSGNQKNLWHEAFFNLYETVDDFQIIIEGTAGTGHLSDIAIDDIALLKDDDCLNDDELTHSSLKPQSPEDEEVFDILSCKHRCYEKMPYSARKVIGTTSNYIIKKCDCHFGCEDLQSCCPDYRKTCVFEMTTESSDDDGDEYLIEQTTLFDDLVEDKSLTFQEENMTTKNLQVSKYETTVKYEKTVKPTLSSKGINFTESKTSKSTISNNFINETNNAEAEISTIASTSTSKLTEIYPAIVTSKKEISSNIGRYFTTISKCAGDCDVTTQAEKDIVVTPKENYNSSENLGISTTMLLLVTVVSLIFTLLLITLVFRYCKHYFDNFGKIYSKSSKNICKKTKNDNEFSEIRFLAADEQLDFTMQCEKKPETLLQEKNYDNNCNRNEKSNLTSSKKHKMGYNARSLNKVRHNSTDENNGLLTEFE